MIVFRFKISDFALKIQLFIVLEFQVYFLVGFYAVQTQVPHEKSVDCVFVEEVPHFVKVVELREIHVVVW